MNALDEEKNKSFPHINLTYRATLILILSFSALALLLGLLVCLLMIEKYPGLGMAFSLLIISLCVFIFITVVNIANTKIAIDSNGVACKSMLKKCMLKWDEIKEVGITQQDGELTKKSYFYFTTYSEKSFSIKYGEKLDATYSIVRTARNDKQIISVQYDPDAYKAIKTYWGKEIKNIDAFMRQNKETLGLPDDFI